MIRIFFTYKVEHPFIDNDPISKCSQTNHPLLRVVRGCLKLSSLTVFGKKLQPYSPTYFTENDIEILQEDNHALKMAMAEKIEMMLAVAGLAELIDGGA
ncbi:hypothetical protein [Peribacillus simplex]|uniref:hypothetical protein n=1 Tax=Peribacillus simplex TaxID=1478 RepID=UPI003D2CD769